ncbi:Elongator complex protein 6 [Gryllus bimaculatus]|nr:Elongator complex protein 6 [Gryllus bimaculatus]
MSALNLCELKEQNAQVETVELISELREHMYCEDECPHDLWDEHNKISVQQLFSIIRDKVRKLLVTHPTVCVIIDDASHFLDMGVSLRDVLSLLQYCRTLLTTFSGVSLVVLTHVITEDDSNLLANNVAHVADTIVNISVLKTGHSSDVTGVMEVKDKQNNDASSEQWNVSSLFHFKVMDRQVKLYAPGTSMLRT